jgi:uncharacterized membrane protein (DUF485 family)
MFDPQATTISFFGMAQSQKLGEESNEGPDPGRFPSANQSGGAQDNRDLTRRVASDSTFETLVRERFALRLILSAIVILTYFSFILLVAFSPSSLATPVTANSVVSVGIAFGVGLILLSVVLTAIYVWRANQRFEVLTQQVLKGINR